MSDQTPHPHDPENSASRDERTEEQEGWSWQRPEDGSPVYGADDASQPPPIPSDSPELPSESASGPAQTPVTGAASAPGQGPPLESRQGADREIDPGSTPGTEYPYGAPPPGGYQASPWQYNEYQQPYYQAPYPAPGSYSQPGGFPPQGYGPPPPQQMQPPANQYATPQGAPLDKDPMLVLALGLMALALISALCCAPIGVFLAGASAVMSNRVKARALQNSERADLANAVFWFSLAAIAICILVLILNIVVLVFMPNLQPFGQFG